MRRPEAAFPGFIGMLYVEAKILSQGLIRGFSEAPQRLSRAGSRKPDYSENPEIPGISGFGPITKSVGELVNVRYVRRGIGVAKSPRRCDTMKPSV